MQANAYLSELLTGATATTASAVRDVSRFDNIVLFVTGTGTIAGGVVTIEEAPSITYGGTWSAVSTVTASDVTGGATKAVHLSVGAYLALRVRVSTTISGGGSIAVTLGAH